MNVKDRFSEVVSARRSFGFSRLELVLTGAGLLVLAGLLTYAVVDTRRRANDAEALSFVRQVQLDLLAARKESASYPASLEALYGAGTGLAYRPLPEGCGPGTERLCTSYELGFALEGRVGTLSGGACTASPDDIGCAP